MSAAVRAPARVTVEGIAASRTFDEAVAHVAAAYDFTRHPYFAWARDPATSREAFRASQAPFRFAVEGWAQALAAVLARVESVELRRGLVKNLADEGGDSPERGHSASFLRYLAALGASEPERSAPCTMAVHAFRHGTTAHCLTASAQAGAAALGIVEHVYVGVSAEIARLVVDRGWVAPGAQDHYEIHEVLDVEHARDLFAIARPGWDVPRARDEVALGLGLGAHAFWQLYLDLLP
ncbi:MAG: iron-containing redox enzyme family protein [Sandaracinaceae bacterium]|nr:iron-containing redox enzyme family protein [Sandaracinaceae bacterium]